MNEDMISPDFIPTGPREQKEYKHYRSVLGIIYYMSYPGNPILKGGDPSFVTPKKFSFKNNCLKYPIFFCKKWQIRLQKLFLCFVLY